MPAGRPSDYGRKLVDEFCRRVASGRSILSVCGDVDMPGNSTIYRWQHEHAEFRDKVTRARDERLEAYSDRLMALGTRVMEEPDLDPQRVNAAANAIDKAARLQQPKTRVELTGRDGGPVEVETSNRDVAKALLGLLGRGE